MRTPARGRVRGRVRGQVIGLGRSAAFARHGRSFGRGRASLPRRSCGNGRPQEIAADRLLPWLAVAYGFGVVIYFTADREPAWWAATALAALCGVGAVVLRRHLVAFVVGLFLFAIAAGFAAATVKTAMIEHPVLHYPASGVTIAGFVELREESQHTDRFVLRVDRIDGNRIDDKPQRVRLSVKRGLAPPAGSFVEVKAMLDPPLQPLAPGSYDFARDLYFQQIGASGFVRGAVNVITPPTTAGLMSRARAVVQRMRDAIDAHVRAVLPGDTGAIAAMLLNGKRDVISENLYNALFISGVGHVLSISGYHMAVVAGVVFFIIRALLALIPGLADRRPIKKWAAFGALIATTFYLVLSGAEVATQRSYFMIAIVLIGVMLDRPALTIRTLTAAALLVLVLAPQSVVHPSFQMSFAATLALVAAYDRGVPRMKAGTDSSLGSRAALWGMQRDHKPDHRVAGRGPGDDALRGLSLSSHGALRRHCQSARHADRFRLGDADGAAWPPRHPVRLRCRVLAANGLRHRMDEHGGAVGGEPARRRRPRHHVRHRAAAAGNRGPAGDRAVQDAAALERRRARGAGHRVGGGTPRPDVLLAADGRTFAVRGADGLLAFHHSGGDTFAIKEWLAADADARDYHDRKLGQGIACDASGCIGKLADGALVAYDLKPDAFEEDCRRAVLIMTTRNAPPDCRGPGDRAFAVARARGAGAAPYRFGLCDRFRPPAEFRSAMGAAALAGRRYGQSDSRSARGVTRTTARRDTAPGRYRSGSVRPRHSGAQ